MSWRDIRPLAVGVPRRDGEVLLDRQYDSVADETFYRPLGGGIEFGELSHEALAREFSEELGVELADWTLLDTHENTFEFEGRPGHEIWFLYEVAFVEDWPYESSEVPYEEDDGESFTAVWLSIADLDDVVVYPESLPALL